MTELERLTEKLQSIFDSYKTDWINFYDDINNSEIVKRNNTNYSKTKIVKIFVANEQEKYSLIHTFTHSLIPQCGRKKDSFTSPMVAYRIAVRMHKCLMLTSTKIF